MWIPGAALVGFALALPWVVYLGRESLFAAGLWSRMFVTAAVAVLLVAGWRSAPSTFRVVIALLLLPLLFVGPARESSLSIHRSSANRDDFDALMRFNEVLKASVPLRAEGCLLGGSRRARLKSLRFRPVAVDLRRV